MNKKSQGLPLSTIVIAVVVLVVLLVLVGIFTGYFGDFVPSLTAAGEQTCPEEQIKDECDAVLEKRVYGNFGDSIPSGKVCCKSLPDCSETNQFCAFESNCRGRGHKIMRETTCKQEGKICCIAAV